MSRKICKPVKLSRWCVDHSSVIRQLPGATETSEDPRVAVNVRTALFQTSDVLI